MAKRKLFFHLFPTYLLIIILSLSASIWYATRLLKDFYLAHVKEELEIRAKIIEDEIAEYVKNKDEEGLERFCGKFSEFSSTRITVIDLSGKVITDSFEDPLKMENHAGRPEIKEAYKGNIGRSVRYSSTLKQNMMYVAIPVNSNNKTSIVLRVAVSLSRIDGSLRDIYLKVVLAGVIIALLGSGFSIFVSRKITAPINEIREGAASFAKGDFSRKLPSSSIKEIAEFANSMNNMAKEINSQLEEIVEQRNLQDAILSSMMEGVIAVDAEARLISFNRSALMLLKVHDFVEGRLFHEVVRNASLQNFVDKILSGKEILEEELSFYGDEKKFLYVRGTVLNDSDANCIGALIVLNDITRLKKLENMRSEFVANVSHEIKTPITAIKASVETILENVEKKEELKSLLKIISRHSDRLAAIVDDILSLAKLESGKDADEGIFKEISIGDIIKTAVELCGKKAAEKNLIIEKEYEEELKASINSSLIEQALINLIDNAVKYSFEKNKVEIKAFSKDGEICISVKDYGCGIPKEHLSRIFERFYRVDKARSRKLGGTGLGLAIVKHIANIHGGKVEVESVVGEGSRFTIIIPKKQT